MMHGTAMTKRADVTKYRRITTHRNNNIKNLTLHYSARQNYALVING